LGAEAIAAGGGHAVFLGEGSPLSQAQGLGFEGPVSTEDLSRMERFFRERGACTQIEVASLADPSLLSALSQRGYLIAEQSHSLIHDFAGVPTSPPSSTSGEIQVSPVEPGDLERWVDLILGCFFEEPGTVPPLLREGAIAMAEAEENTSWVATIDGEPAGGAGMMIVDGLALMYGDGTLPRFRGRGVQARLLQARLAVARDRGAGLASIFTQPGSGSQRNAERQGFRMAYARTMMALEK
jgi:GNAT superfamily N-acetyltransferase